MKRFLICFLALFVTFAKSEEVVDIINQSTSELNRSLLVIEEERGGAVFDMLLVSAGITAWGFSEWGWGRESFHFKNEGWFEKNSKTGGSDKTGHFYMTYLLSRVMAARMQERGLSLEESSLYGAFLGMGAMTLLEVGDATSAYGFSKEDLVADGLGALLAYVVRAYPRVDDFIDIRFEYFPKHKSEDKTDLTTDYSNMRHLIALKPSGFEFIRDTPLEFVELQVGYYSRGFRSYDTMNEKQHLYLGVGISLADIARKTGVNVLQNTFEFYQPGGTYLDADLWTR
jgi:hypothetical protein